MLEIQYEELAARPEEYIPKMIEFCGLEWDPRCLRFHELQRDVNTPSYEQVRQPMYTRSIVIMERPAPDSQTVGYAADRGTNRGTEPHTNGGRR